MPLHASSFTVAVLLCLSTVLVAAKVPPPLYNHANNDDDDDVFRPPMTPLITFAPMHQIFMLGNITHQPITSQNASDRAGQYWSGLPMGINVMVRLENAHNQELTCVFQLLGNNSIITDGGVPRGAPPPVYAELDGYPIVTPLVTHLRFLVTSSLAHAADCQLPGLQLAGDAIVVHLRFVHTKIPDRMDLMQLPFVFMEVQLESNISSSSSETTASVYVDMNSYNAMHLMSDEIMTWDVTDGSSSPSEHEPVRGSGTFHDAKLGTAFQPILESFGDDFMLDWGYLHIVTMADDANAGIASSATGANASACRQAFRSGASQLPPEDTFKPRFASDGFPVIAAMTTFPLTNATTRGETYSSSVVVVSNTVRFVIGYDESGMQYYFGDVLYGAWTRAAGGGTNTFLDVAVAALKNYTEIRSLVTDFDTSLMAAMSERISPHYAKIGALAFRQTFAAIEFTYSDRFREPWAFLKEISSDGDINTMDVIFPASPLLFFVAPEVVKMLLLPVLHYAINQTWNAYTYPFCPHQLGTYPVANITTAQQEVMPAENTGNMFLMLLAYMQKTNFTDTDWIYDNYWTVLTDWAMYMVQTQLPVPPHQICTDDFAGPLAENTNLAAKCVVALEAYAEMCDVFEVRYGKNTTPQPPENGWHCDVFHDLATSYAEFWTAFAVETDPILLLNHSRLAFNQPNTWSTKYNMLWQKLLGLSRPFQNFDALAANEVAYYRAKSNTFGFPMDDRHTYQKLDWMTWGSCLSSNVTEFAEMFEGIYRMANDTTSRWPLTDLFDTVSADIVLDFRSRPVVGAVFAAMLLY